MITKIGKYEIRAELGHDAFARTFQAFDPDAARPVTIMVLTEVADKQRLTSFRDDGAIAANLHHRNIAAIYELGEHVGLPFIAMQHLEGEDLRQVIAKRAPLTLLQKMRLMFEVADALEAAHRGGMTHVGLRAAGVILLDDGSAKIIEFGALRLTRPAGNGSARQETHDSDALYLSPEQLTSAASPDALSDIFVYGTIYYELLAGKHPFAAADNPAVIGKIAKEDPVPLRTLCPDCPEALEQIVHRALQKDRELRYQSLDDVQCDAEPILQELKRDQAAALLIEGRRLVSEGQFDLAQAVVREALELDPSNREARHLRDAVRDRLQRRIIRSRLDALLRQADEQVAAGRFGEAVQILESGLRLDAADAAIRSRLDQARGLLERSDKAAALLAEARRLFADQDLAGACRSASEALENDPQSQDAYELLETIRKAIEHREQEIQFEEELTKAKSLVLRESFEEAIAILAGLEAKRSDSSQVAHWLAHARTQKSEKERRDRLQAGLVEARRQLENRQLREAVDRLKVLGGEFPEEQSVLELCAEASSRLQGHERAEAVRKIRTEALALFRARDFASAVRILEQGLQSYPEEAELQRALEETVAASASYEREQVVARVLAQCARCREEHRLDEALELVNSSLTMHGGDAALLDLRGQLEKEREERQRAAAVRKAQQEAQWLMDQGRLDLAVQLLRQNSTAYPQEAGLAEWLALAEQALSDWERRRFLRETLDRVAALEQRQQWRAALTVLQEALQSHPDAAELTEAAERLQSRLRENERQRKLARRLEIIRHKMAEQAWMQALLLIEDSQKDFPAEPELDRLCTQARAEQQRVECEDLIIGIDRRLADGELEQAAEIIRKAIACYPGETRLQALQEELERENDYQDQWRVAEVLFGRGEFREAEKILLELAGHKPDNPDVQALLEAVRSGRAASEEKQFYDRGREKAIRLVEEQQWDQAVGLLRNLLSVFPNDPILERDLQSALAAQDQHGDGADIVPLEEEEEEVAPASPAAQTRDSQPDASVVVPAAVVAERAQPPAKPEPAPLSRASLQVVVSSWRRPALLSIAAFFLLTSATVPLWRLSRRQHSVAPASPAPALAKAAAQEPREPRVSAPLPAAPPTAAGQAIADKTEKKLTVAPTRRRLAETFTVRRASAAPRAGSLVPPPPPARILDTAAGVPTGLPGAVMEPIASAPAPPAPVVIHDAGSGQAEPARPRIGGEFHGPQLLSGPKAVVLPFANEHGIHGVVSLEATISKEGAVTKVTATAGHPVLVEAAKRAILARRYRPATLNGEPLEVKVPIQVVFEPNR
ncbi:MAG TPA: protein kinase [Bryobacterales bacterium]|nr:protein kinase [Bryobacterales bacterium]